MATAMDVERVVWGSKGRLRAGGRYVGDAGRMRKNVRIERMTGRKIHGRERDQAIRPKSEGRTEKAKAYLPGCQKSCFNRVIMLHPSQRDPVPNICIKTQRLTQLASTSTLHLLQAIRSLRRSTTKCMW